MQTASWTVTEPGEARAKRASAPGSEQIEYITLLRGNDDMSDGERDHIRKWNLMVKTLRDNGLMHDKGDKGEG